MPNGFICTSRLSPINRGKDREVMLTNKSASLRHANVVSVKCSSPAGQIENPMAVGQTRRIKTAEPSTSSRQASGHRGASQAELKIRQGCKIKELGDALIAAGYVTLGQQAQALGLARSTAWTILRASHKGSGLSA